MNFVAVFGLAEQFSRITELRFECVFYFWGNLIAAAANAGANNSFQIGGTRAEVLAHFTHALFDDALNGSAPASVEDSNGMAFGINQNHRQTVGGENSEQDARCPGDKPISSERVFGRLGNAVNDVGVNLPKGDEGPSFTLGRTRRAWLHACDKCANELLPVALHRGPRVVLRKSEVQCFSAVNFRNSTGSRAEPMHQPRHLR